MSQNEYLEAWYAALNSANGRVVITDDPETATRRLYAARKASDDPRLMDLSIVRSPTTETEIWIIRRVRNEA